MKKWLLTLMICLSFSTLTAGLFLLPHTINVAYQREQNAEEDPDAEQSALNYDRYDWTSTVAVKTITLSCSGALNSPTTTIYANSCQDVYNNWRNDGGLTPIEYSYQNDDLVRAKGPVLPIDSGSIYIGNVVHFAKVSLSGVKTRTSTAWNSTDSSYVMPTFRSATFAGYWSASSGGTQYITVSGTITTAGKNACAYGSGGSTTWYAQYTSNNTLITLYPYTTAPDSTTIATSTWLSSFTLQVSPSGKSQWKTISASYVYTGSEYYVPSGWDIKFRANCNSGYAVWKIMYNSSRVWPDADGYYTISSLSSSTSGTYYFYPLAGYKVSVTAGTGGTVQHQTSSPKMSSISGGVKSNTSFTATSSGNWYVSDWSNYIDIYARANTGYTFDYFSPSDTSGTVTYSKSVYAYFKAIKCQLTLNPNSGIGSTQTIYAMYNSAGLYANSTPKDYTSASITTPTRVGYSFGGWQTSGGVKVIDASNNLVANTSYTNSSRQWTYTSALTLYAKWTTNTYTLTFNANGGSVSSATKTVTYGTTLTNLPTPTRSGYNFKGWYYDVTGSNYINYGRYYMYTDRVSVHVMVYMSNWSTLPADTSFISSTEGGGWTIYENADHKMAYDAFDSGVGYKTAVATRSATNLSSGWHTFDLVFNGTCVKGYIDGALVATGANFTSGNMGYPSSNSIFVGAESASDAWTPANTTFNGYVGNVIIRNNDTLSTGTEYNTITAPAQNATLYARWENATFTTTFNGNGGGINYATSTSSTFGIDGSFEGFYSTGTSVPFEDQTGGSTFVVNGTISGYDDDDDDFQAYSGSRYLTVNAVAGSSNRFYKYGSIPNGCTYKFIVRVYIPNYSGISSLYLHTEKYGGNYNWSGVESSSTSTKGHWVALSCEETSPITSATTLYAFIYMSGSGIFYIDDWQVLITSMKRTVTHDSTYGTLPTPTREGYTFDGWYTAASGGSQVTDSTTVSATTDHTLYAHWTANSYYVSYNINYGSTYVNQLTLYDSNPLASSYSTTTGNTTIHFDGSNVSGNTTNGLLFQLRQDSTWTSLGWWDESNIGQHLTSNSFTVNSTFEYLTVKINTPLNDPGYGITPVDGWVTGRTYVLSCDLQDFDSSGCKATISNLKLEARTTATSWTPSPNLVTYDSTYGTMFSPTRSNYTFSGWYDQKGNSGVQMSSSTQVKIIKNTTLYAKWTPIQRNITFKGRIVGKNGTVTNADNLPSGAEIKVSYFDGYGTGVFATWFANRSATFTTAVSDTYAMHQGTSMTITPNIVPAGYKYIGYKTSGTSKPSVSSFPTSSSITVPSSDKVYYLYFQEIAAPLYYTTERGGYWYYEDGEYPQTYVGTSLSGASETGSTFNINGTNYTVYSLGASKYIQVASPMSGTIKFNGQTVTLNAGTKYWFRIDPIRWRVSNYGASATAYSLASATSNLVGVSDILGYGRVNTNANPSQSYHATNSSIRLSNVYQSCSAVGFSNITKSDGTTNMTYTFDQLSGDETSSKTTTYTMSLAQEDYLVVASVSDIQKAAHNGTAQENLQTYASDLSAMLQCRDYNNSTGWTSSIYNIGSGIVVGPGASYTGKYWGQLNDGTYNTYGFVYAHQASYATCLNRGGIASTYTKMNYIESSGTQYINTGIKSNANITKIEAKYYQTTSEVQQILFGMYTGSSYGYTYSDYRENGATYTCAWFGTVIDSGVEMAVGDVNSTITTNGTSFTYSVNGKTVAGTAQGAPYETTNYYLFADNNNGTAIYQFKCRLYAFKIYVDGILTRDFVPVKRNSDSVYGLYDVVTRTFYANSGSGSFTGG